MPKYPVVNAMTVDVEDYFQVSSFENVIPRADWETLPCRVERNTDKILESCLPRMGYTRRLLPGWVAQRFPSLIRRIAHAGHEIASHGLTHVRVTQQNRNEFYHDVSKTKAILEDISGQSIKGFRAASFSISSTHFGP